MKKNFNYTSEFISNNFNGGHYDYEFAVYQDVLQAVENLTAEEVEELKALDPDDIAGELEDRFWADDSITGNGSGSYFCNSFKAEMCLVGNWDIIGELIAEGFRNSDIIARGAEAVDVFIRCYFLRGAIERAICEAELTE